MDKDNEMAHQPRLIKEDGPEYKTNEAEKEAYRERLRDYLQDPAFRAIEGFPIGEDEDILALSDPPYFTACPNPFLPEIIEAWQQERAELREKLGLGGDDDYHREPFATDVSEGKNNAIYNAHTYHTKVPHKAIMRYILHYTEPGDIIFDGFCGTGMTGVAAQLCGDRQEVEELGYFVDETGNIYEQRPLGQNGKMSEKPIAKLGTRKVMLNDLSPTATFIAYNYNTPVNVEAFEKEAKRIIRLAEKKIGWMYKTWHSHDNHTNRTEGKINYVVWSDMFSCPECGKNIDYWDEAVDLNHNNVDEIISCTGCGILLAKSPSKKSGALKFDRNWNTYFDGIIGKPVQIARKFPKLINYSLGRKRYEKAPDEFDLELIDRVWKNNEISYIPVSPLPEGDKMGDPINFGMTHMHHFYTIRNLITLTTLFENMRNSPLNRQLFFIITSILDRVSLRNRYMPQHRGNRSREVVGPLSGTLYIPTFSLEINVLEYALSKINHFVRFFSFPRSQNHVISTQSSTHINEKNCVDYIFVDPPFGYNLMYSELNFLSESWLKVITKNNWEAIINDTQSKKLVDYQRLMEKSFVRFHKLLKPGRWITVEFHNSQNSVWNSIQEAVVRAGFVVGDIRVLDKQKGTTKQLTQAGTVKQDLVISAYKPHAQFEKQFLTEAGTEDGAWEFVRQHLAHLPVVVVDGSVIETLSERQDYLLFDRMVAFHIQRGASVPLSAGGFYAGLRQRFMERDGMFFLPEQVAEYDKVRLEADSVAQLTLFVTDEKSSIQWLRQQLAPEFGGYPQNYQEIQPRFLKQLHQLTHEALPELSHLLEENFLQDEQGRWYIPDPSKAGDLEKLRQKGLLREFNGYLEGKKRLKQFRTEAVRAGFGKAWSERDYKTIVKVAERLPEQVLQEDPDLLMYYDNASLMV